MQHTNTASKAAGPICAGPSERRRTIVNVHHRHCIVRRRTRLWGQETAQAIPPRAFLEMQLELFFCNLPHSTGEKQAQVQRLGIFCFPALVPRQLGSIHSIWLWCSVLRRCCSAASARQGNLGGAAIPPQDPESPKHKATPNAMPACQ